MDAYTIYAASAIASTVVLRSALACAFPLFSPAMFNGLGDSWAMSVFAFLSLACTPLPILFYVSKLTEHPLTRGLRIGWTEIWKLCTR